MPRDPFSKLVKYIIPCFLLDTMILVTFGVKTERLSDRVLNVGLFLFAFVSLFSALMTDFPEISNFTVAAKFMSL